MMDGLLADTSIEDALSRAYAAAVAWRAGYTIAQYDFDVDGVDMQFAAGGDMRPKLDVQLKATVNLPSDGKGKRKFVCPVKNYKLLRIQTQVPRILVVLHLPPNKADWLTLSPQELVLRNCAFWMCLHGAAETENDSTITIDIPESNRFNVEELQKLMNRSRTGNLP